MTYSFGYNIDMSFADQLRVAMALKGMNQTDLARLSGVGQPVLSRLASGERKPSFDTLERLEAVLPELRKLHIEVEQRAA